MASSPGLGLCLALSLQVLKPQPALAQSTGYTGYENTTTPSTAPPASGALCYWSCWVGNFVRNARQRAPTGPAVKSSCPTRLKQPQVPRTRRTRRGAGCPAGVRVGAKDLGPLPLCGEGQRLWWALKRNTSPSPGLLINIPPVPVAT
ncbi:protein crumbs homolog 3 isoform X1 [Notamacropus eugenii]|uniref:protein crumbs homolog 3 isoform X1 n=1 Tax=Notamacropus eugenii TaxID=9315 RepID=UPI003B675374